ncbi:hypothetical protein [Sulfitobacter sp. R18_1]|uniref:hypothetical protein n=1 Tax=Sulfitobacter sp. R18_1 TaxID=2821104 RepID=UPI001ADB9382|nr:hypothetical protein [Sulfitobacter sp. R18_1]MBO9428041.1 hypothetical protein [Sulfitobacter sp. R18_1]
MSNTEATEAKRNLLLKIRDSPGMGLSLPILVSHWAFFPLVIAHFVVLLEKTSGSWARYHSYPGEGLIIPVLIAAMLLMTATKVSDVKYGPSKSRLVKLGIVPFEVITLILSAPVAWISGLFMVIALVGFASSNGIFGIPIGLWHALGIYLFLYWFVAYGNGPRPDSE